MPPKLRCSEGCDGAVLLVTEERVITKTEVVTYAGDENPVTINPNPDEEDRTDEEEPYFECGDCGETIHAQFNGVRVQAFA